MGLNRWKDGTGSFLAALCLSYLKARLSICSPNKLELLFGILQIPKQPRQVKISKGKGKSARAAILSFLPSSLTISIVKPQVILGRRGMEQRNKKILLSASLLMQASVSSQGTHRTPKLSVPQGWWKNMEAHTYATFWGFPRHFESDSLFCIHPDIRQGPRGFGQLLWQKSFNSSSWCQISHRF